MANDSLTPNIKSFILPFFLRFMDRFEAILQDSENKSYSQGNSDMYRHSGSKQKGFISLIYSDMYRRT